MEVISTVKSSDELVYETCPVFVECFHPDIVEEINDYILDKIYKYEQDKSFIEDTKEE